MLFLPFDGKDQKSLFVVVNAGRIRDYLKVGYNENRPCIIHLDPNKSDFARHNGHAIADRIYVWLNTLWRYEHDKNNNLLMPFFKRSMPLCCPKGEYTRMITCSTHNTPLISLDSRFDIHIVPKPTHWSNDGACIIRYAQGMSRFETSALTERQFEYDRHFNHVFAKSSNFRITDDSLLELRKNCITILSDIAEKYTTNYEEGDIDDDSVDSDINGPDCNCCTATSRKACSCTGTVGSHTLSSSYSSLPSSQSTISTTISSESSSAFVPECDVERDYADSLYGDEDSLSISSNLSCSACSQQSSFGTDKSESIQATNYIASTPRAATMTGDDSTCVKDNLICPGDVIEYKLQTGLGTAKRDSIVTIHKTLHKTYVVMKSGVILKPRKHSVRKIKMFCGATEHLISNPLAAWYPLGSCVLQHGSLLEPESCSSDDDSSSCNNSIGHWSSEISISSSNCSNNDEYHRRRRPKKNGKKRRLRTSEGLTNKTQEYRMRKVRRENKFLDSAPDYPTFTWAEKGSDEYYTAIDAINSSYRKMLKIGKAQDAFRHANDNVSSMISAQSKSEFDTAKRNIDRRFDRHIKSGKGVLKNFNLRTELLPNPRRYANSGRKIPSRRQTIINEEILTFEQYLSTLNVFKCTVCFECNIEAKALTDNDRYTCASCTRRDDPSFFIDNNLHPIWYLCDDEGNQLLDNHNAKIPQYHIPPELSCLTISEKLLIRRCANFVPCVHLKNGVFGIKGHCVTFPQDITSMCDELPLAKNTVVTFLRNIANKNTSAVFPTTLRVNRERLLTALKWLKQHNPFYKNIRIVEANLDWMNGQEEANICTAGIDMNLKETASSKKKEQEEEFVSTSNKSNEDLDDHCNGIQISTVHANTRQKVPSGRQAAPIREFIDLAKKTNQTSKIMNFPPIDHDSPIR